MILKHYCDHCGNELDAENHYPVFCYMGGEELIFCNGDCKYNFIDENTKYLYLDIKGRWVED